MVRLLQDNREMIAGAAGAIPVTAGAAWVVWRGLRALRPASVKTQHA
jgi:hypothetical protein